MEDPPGIVITDVFNCIEICIFFFSFLPRVNDYQYHLSIVLVLYFSLFLDTACVREWGLRGIACRSKIVQDICNLFSCSCRIYTVRILAELLP